MGGNRGPRLRQDQKEEIISLRLTGMTYQEIAEREGVSISAVGRICKGMNVSCEAKSQRDNRNSEMREFKAQGHTNKEVAERFGVSEETAKDVCAGIAPQVGKGSHEKLKFENRYDELEELAKETIRLKTPWLEYVGEYSGSDGKCKVRCRTCGSVFYRSFVSIRHGTASCDACKQAEQNNRDRERAEAKAAKIIAQEQKREKRREEKRLEKERRDTEREARRHPCVICGTPTTNKYTCSKACSLRRGNQLKEIRRRAKLAEAMVDRDITLERLYERDDGRCHICGGQCDWSAREIRSDCIVALNEYPSIDHVVPLAKGGAHSWENVALAHRICNSLKGDHNPAGGLLS